MSDKDHETWVRGDFLRVLRGERVDRWANLWRIDGDEVVALAREIVNHDQPVIRLPVADVERLGFDEVPEYEWCDKSMVRALRTMRVAAGPDEGQAVLVGFRDPDRTPPLYWPTRLLAKPELGWSNRHGGTLVPLGDEPVDEESEPESEPAAEPEAPIVPPPSAASLAISYSLDATRGQRAMSAALRVADLDVRPDEADLARDTGVAEREIVAARNIVVGDRSLAEDVVAGRHTIKSAFAIIAKRRELAGIEAHRQETRDRRARANAGQNALDSEVPAS